jgi:hypothetical protein
MGRVMSETLDYSVKKYMKSQGWEWLRICFYRRGSYTDERLKVELFHHCPPFSSTVEPSVERPGGPHCQQ